ncbi:MAG TPA: co-chaperone GroES [Verrucomicrobiae bacterium]|jgi:chaperonin GroES|nr:co-chaperone GroES [Candidatus Polarisedimenticolia bacterium]HYV17661.1 co-chaperone GroES [Verrucomicrobiae bacterium]
MKVKPLNDRVLVRRMEAEEKMKGGIIIPDTAKEKPLEGKVVSVGAGRLDENGKRIPMEVKAGDRVLVGKYSGTEVKIDDIEHVILREDEILGIVS